MAGKNAFYLLFAYEQNTLGVPFYSKAAPAGTVDVNPVVKQLMALNDFFDYEVYDLYYDKINLDSFLISIKEDYVSKRSLRKILQKIKASNWNKMPPFTETTKLGGRRLKGETFSYVSMLYTSGTMDVNAILDMDAMNGTYPGFCVEVLKPDIPTIHNWFTRNRVPKRNYHWSSKHGEFGKGNWPGVSVLLGSRQEAEQVLHAAVGTKEKKDLYIYDKTYGKYMRYMPENVNDTYHSFHIDKNEIDPHIKAVVLKKLGKI